MLHSFLLGAAYGIGGTAFGISIRYIGFSLTYAIAVGLSSVLGTLIPPLVKGTLRATLSKPGADWIVAGIVVGTLGIAWRGLAGRLKERDLGRPAEQRASSRWSRACCCRCWPACCRPSTASPWKRASRSPTWPRARRGRVARQRRLHLLQHRAPS